jgi:hypothetical protein
MCRLSWNVGASTSWNPQGLSMPIMGLHYLYLTVCWTGNHHLQTSLVFHHQGKRHICFEYRGEQVPTYQTARCHIPDDSNLGTLAPREADISQIPEFLNSIFPAFSIEIERQLQRYTHVLCARWKQHDFWMVTINVCALKFSRLVRVQALVAITQLVFSLWLVSLLIVKARSKTYKQCYQQYFTVHYLQLNITVFVGKGAIAGSSGRLSGPECGHWCSIW